MEYGNKSRKEIKGNFPILSHEFYFPFPRSLFAFANPYADRHARVSTHDQNLHLQQDALRAAGCEKIFVDEVSGTLSERPGLTKTLDALRKGDTLVVWRLDRLGRSLKDLIGWVHTLETQGIEFKSLQEAIDTGSSSGKLTFHLFAALAEFERNLIRERTQAGLSAARARGRAGGRPKALDKDKRALTVELYDQKKLSLKKIDLRTDGHLQANALRVCAGKRGAQISCRLMAEPPK